MGLIYYHVKLLNDIGKQARILHFKNGFRISWLDINVPVRSLDQQIILADDILIVPEGLASDSRILGIECRKMVFIQAAFYILRYTDKFINYEDLGYEKAICTMPHIEKIVKTHFHSSTSIVSPFPAPYFKTGNFESIKKRSKLIVVYPKIESLDYDILIKFLRLNFQDLTSKKVRYNPFNSEWKFVEIKNKTHKQVASIMQSAAFFISVNVMEGFNASIAEAMNAGCSVLAYEGYGAVDYLQDQENAFVFKDHDIYSIIHKLTDLIQSFDSYTILLDDMRRKSSQTMKNYNEEKTISELKELFD